ncbi:MULTISPECIES: flavoprotein [unclassified Crossiella]|uniref:flavoprotein n=1 Tax=unclassified Crossiella TaxID=2620835 RepID=UPI001FFE5A2F|nr:MULTISPECIES: flavoprotein [unclassified Crossiella]MCK2242095.1 hypothetical protein [Crossiella sp. S99.2]MCK2255998.1 hypothetical protein [Crossiella sp. S99.1]
MTEQEPVRPRRVLVVITGSIMAAFMPTWISLIRAELRCVVQVLLTESAAELVSAQALSALTGRPIAGPAWRADQSGGAEHVVLAQWAEIVVVVPATMNFCAKLTVGLCDDLASTTVHSATAPTVLVPSLPTGCLAKPATRRVLGTLSEDGHLLVRGTATSVTTGEQESGGPGTIDDLIGALITLGVAPVSALAT